MCSTCFGFIDDGYYSLAYWRPFFFEFFLGKNCFGFINSSYHYDNVVRIADVWGTGLKQGPSITQSTSEIET